MIGLDGAELARLALTLAIGFGGAWIAQKLRVPAGTLIGPMVAIGLLNLAEAPLAQLGPGYRYLAQILVGATVAVNLTPAVLSYMLRLAGPAVFALALLVVLGVLGGWAMHVVAGMPLVEALFAGAPGGVVEMALAADDLGGDLELVAALHLMRLLSVIILVPPLLRWRFSAAARGDHGRDQPDPER